MPEVSSEPSALNPTTQPIRLVVYGDPGVGKTTLALDFPRPFVIDTDGGLEGDSVAGRTDIVSASPEGYRDLESLLFWLKKNTERFDTIVFDSLDGLIRLLLNEIVDQGKGKAQAKSSYILEVVPEQAEYLANQRQVERILSDFRRLGKHIVVTSAVRQREGAKRQVEAAPKLQHIINGWAAIMGELVVVRLSADGTPSNDGTPTRVLMVDPSSEKRECKTRWASLTPYVVSPSFQTLWAAASASPDKKKESQ